MMGDVNISFYLLITLVALLYASIGHGGATGYIAIMTLFNFLPEKIRPLALVLNIIAASIAFFFYRMVVKPPIKTLFFLLLGSIPMAYLGGQFSLNSQWYKYILAFILVFPAYRLLSDFNIEEKELENPNPLLPLFVGILLGFISGIIGIGGGVLLAPLLVFLHWATLKEASFISALFIVLNSIAGLLGLMQKVSILPFIDLPLCFLVAGAAVFGAYYGSHKLPIASIKKILAIVLIIAIIKLIFVS